MNFLTTIFVLWCINGIFGLPQKNIADDHDDSDMWMEADELPAPQYSVVRSESRVVRQYSSSPQHDEIQGGFRPMRSPPTYSSISRVEQSDPVVTVSSSLDAQNTKNAEQNFFSSFFRNPAFSANSRPFRISPAASIAGSYRVNKAQTNFDQSILGNGDFAVIRGGTFYPEGERSYRLKGGNDFFASFKNGHGRPNAQTQTAPKEAYYPENPFENFKDFADISADPAPSHFFVVYANKNSTQPHPSHPSPKNIFEQLQLLDLEKEEENKKQSETEVEEELSLKEKEIKEKKLMKLSKFKSKLAKTKVVKKYKKKLGPKVDTSPDYTDPLLAMS